MSSDNQNNRPSLPGAEAPARLCYARATVSRWSRSIVAAVVGGAGLTVGALVLWVMAGIWDPPDHPPTALDCCATLFRLGVAAMEYYRTHGRLPGHLSSAVEEHPLLNRGDLRCPVGGNAYIYFPDLDPRRDPRDWILMYESASCQEDGRVSVLYLNLYCERITALELERRLDCFLSAFRASRGREAVAVTSDGQ